MCAWPKSPAGQREEVRILITLETIRSLGQGKLRRVCAWVPIYVRVPKWNFVLQPYSLVLVFFKQYIPRMTWKIDTAGRSLLQAGHQGQKQILHMVEIDNKSLT